MKKIVGFFIAALLASNISSGMVFASDANKEMRGVWVASVYNIDFPSVSSKGNSQAQKAQLEKTFDDYKNAGLNSVFLQVRPKGDALYNSEINPWSDVLTGQAGKSPGYDPLEFAIETAHAKGLKLHAWLNPYRVTTSGVDVYALDDLNIAKQHPQWLITHNNALYLNPALEEVQNFICETVKEILINYNVDGIHFDDYFYPSNYPLTEGGKDGIEADTRRENVNNLIKKVNEVVKQYGKGAEFGISPMGIYKNVDGYIAGSESYYTVFGDSLKWVENEWVDYITPQVYWETSHKTAAYENVVSWWNDAVEGTDVRLYIGEGIYKDAVATEIDTHFEICEKYSNIKGNFFYSSKDLLSNREGVLDKITTIYKAADSKNDTLTAPKPVVPSKTVTAVPTSSSVLVDGSNVDFEAYNIDGFNYFKLRDIAYSLNNTHKPFNTVWNEKEQAITLEIGKDYEVTGGELSKGKNTSKKAVYSTAKLYVNGSLVDCDAYNIDGSNYYKLRDVAKAVDFAVVWSENINSIGIVSYVGYEFE